MVGAILGRRPAGSTTIKPIKIGGGGFVINMDIANDGTKIAGVDIFGLWRCLPGASVWELLTTAERMPEAAIAFNYGRALQPDLSPAVAVGGPYAARIAPSDSSVMYAYYSDGYIYRTRDRGTRWERCPGWTKKACSSNGSGKRDNNFRMAIDPINPAVMYVATPRDSDGRVYVTKNGGETFTQLTEIPLDGQFANYSGGALIAFDKNGGTTGGRTSVVYVMSHGNGVYANSAAGDSFALQSGSPTSTDISSMVVGAAGVIYACGDGNTYRRSGGTWSTVITGSNHYALAVDPANTARVLGWNHFGNANESSSSGAAGTWSTGTDIAQSYPDIPWMADTVGLTGYTTSMIIFDPSQSNKLYCAYGFGVSVGSPAPNSAYTMTGFTVGMENLTYDTVMALPRADMAGKVIINVWDQMIFRVTDPDNYTATKHPSGHFSHAWFGDYTRDGGLVASFIWQGAGGGGPQQNDYSCYSLDAGQSWTQWGGSIVTQSLITSQALVSGNTLTFASVPGTIIPGMYLVSPFRAVISKTATTITVDGAPFSVGLGATVQFDMASGGNGSFAVSTADNWVLCTSDNGPGPFYTQDRGQTWQRCSFPDVPTYMNGTVTKGSTTIASLAYPDGSAVNSNCFQAGDTMRLLRNGYNTTVASKPSSTSIAVGYSFATTTTQLSNSGTNTLTVDQAWAFAIGDVIDVMSSDAVVRSYTIQNITINRNVGPTFNPDVITLTGNLSVSVNSGAAISRPPQTAGTEAVLANGVGTWASYTYVKSVCADGATDGTFYAQWQRGIGNGAGEFFRSQDGGATWVKRSGTNNTTGAAVGAGNLKSSPYFMNFYSKIKCPFGQAGHVYMGGNGSNLLKSTDGGANWIVVGGISEVGAFGFGKAKPGGSGYPAMYIVGVVGTVPGVYRADDADQATPNWILLDRQPKNVLNYIGDLDGDKGIYGRFYGCWGHAAFVGALNSAAT